MLAPVTVEALFINLHLTDLTPSIAAAKHGDGCLPVPRWFVCAPALPLGKFYANQDRSLSIGSPVFRNGLWAHQTELCLKGKRYRCDAGQQTDLLFCSRGRHYLYFPRAFATNILEKTTQNKMPSMPLLRHAEMQKPLEDRVPTAAPSRVSNVVGRRSGSALYSSGQIIFYPTVIITAAAHIY